MAPRRPRALVKLANAAWVDEEGRLYGAEIDAEGWRPIKLVRADSPWPTLNKDMLFYPMFRGRADYGVPVIARVHSHTYLYPRLASAEALVVGLP